MCDTEQRDQPAHPSSCFPPLTLIYTEFPKRLQLQSHSQQRRSAESRQRNGNDTQGERGREGRERASERESMVLTEGEESDAEEG